MKPDIEKTPLAVIGISCLFPKAGDRKAYWSNVREKVDCVTEVPESHWKLSDYYDADPKKPDMTYGRRGGFLSPVDFDPTEFGISPNNIPATDPAQLLSLVVAQEAMRDAGYGPEREFDRKKVSVILGVTGTLEIVAPLTARLGHPVWRRALAEAGIEGEQADFIVQRIADSYVGWQENSFPGLLGNVVAGRIANRLDLGGTNCVVDAACASSLSAAHLAALELESGRAEMVVTGGVDAFNDIFMYMCFSKTPALSPTGDSRPFDSQGDGTILGEGIGMLVLKRLADAERDGDRVYAVLKGIGSSSDGRGKAIYAPSPEGQVQALKNAYAMAGVTPDTIELVEAHGTGTKVGDAAEVKALTEVYREARTDGTWCALGSVKSQIGHTKAAAGSAGLIKAVMALHHKVLPPTIKIRQPLPEIAAGTTPFYANTEKRPWMAPAAHPRRAAVSAFGFGGSNFHAVLEEYRPGKEETDWDGAVQVAAFSADDAAGLKAKAAAFGKDLKWDEVRVKAMESRKAFSPAQACRLAIVLEKGKTDLGKTLQSALDNLDRNAGKKSWSTPDGIYFGSGAPGKLGMVFPGQGAQYVGMGRDVVCAFPAGHGAVAAADQALGERLSDMVYPYPAFDDHAREMQESALRATTEAQPGIGAVSVGMLKVLREFGVAPEAVAGHSYGELTALYAAGAFDESSLYKLSRLRGKLMAAGGGDKGTMLAVQAPIAEIEKTLAETKLDVIIANRNAPKQAVLSGSTEAIQRAAEALTAKGMKCVMLPVAAAFHSYLVADAKTPFRAALKDVKVAAPAIPVYSNTTAQPYPQEADAIRDLLAGQIAAPVEFVSEIERMHSDGVRTFVEVGPGARMTGLVKAILGDKEYESLAVDASSGKRGGITDLARALAQIATLGYALDLNRWENGEQGVRDVTGKKKPKISVPVSGATPRVKLVTPYHFPALTPAKNAAPAPTRAPASAAFTEQTPVAPVAPQENSMVSPIYEGLIALQRLQEQTANLHRQFLEGQEATQRTLLALINSGTPYLLPAAPSAPVAVPAPAAVQAAPAPQPVPAPVPPKPAPVAAAPAAAPSDSTNGAFAAVVEKTLLGVVSEKTGYPVETLNLDMGMESDLGIDSIKRVEILSALREKLPQAPVVGPQHIGTLRTIRQVIDFLSANAGTAPAAPAPVAAAPTSSGLQAAEVEKALLSVVSEKTGYPVETLNLDMGMESDLGIDSIKRVEILSALREKLPQAPVVGPQHIGTLRTIRQVIEFLSQGAAAAEPAPCAVEQAPAPSPSREIGFVSPNLVREVLTTVLLDGGRAAVTLPKQAKFLVTDDGTPFSKAVAEKLNAAGFRAKLAKPLGIEIPSGLAGFVAVAPADAQAIKDVFTALKAAAPELKRSAKNGGAVFATISRMDGAFGLQGKIAEPMTGAMAGILKTAAREWPEVACKAIDVAADMKDAQAAEAAVGEMLLAGPVEVGVSKAGRVSLGLRPETIDAGRTPLNAGDVVVITGGARGVTAATALALAHFKPVLVLLGRTELHDEPAELAACKDEGQIKKAIVARANGKPPTPKAIEEEYRRIAANREVRANIALMEAAGAKVLYKAVDIREEAAVAQAVAEIRASGPIRALIHGAGVLADRLIEDKTPAQFDSVFDTKVAGLRALLKTLKDEELKAIVLFSSVTGRFGRIGQSDYAAANEVLNKTAQVLARRMPNTRVVSVNWGPWDGGMVTPSLKKVFEQEGAQVIPLDAGAIYLLAEMAMPPGSPVEVVVTAGKEVPPAAPAEGNRFRVTELVFDREIAVSTHPFLESHVISGQPVLPLAMTVEFLAHGALHGNPGLRFHGFDDLRVLKGVVLKDGAPAGVRVLAGKAMKEGALYKVPVEMRGADAKGTLHASAQVLLSAKLPAFEGAPLKVTGKAYPRSIEKAYDEILFHGPMLKAITAVESVSAEGIAATVAAAPAPSVWMKSPLRSSWITDPLAVDAAFQLMILWSFEMHGAGCLPSSTKSFRQYRAFPKDGLRIVARVTKQSANSGTADIDFIDDKGIVARLSGHEGTIDASLMDSFRKKHWAGVS